jgi:hypothetical protein
MICSKAQKFVRKIRIRTALPIHANSSSNVPKSWVPTENTKLQKVTTQALLYEVSLEQMNSSNKVVPWFLKNMPVS